MSLKNKSLKLLILIFIIYAHECHKLKTKKSLNSENFSLLHTNICSLQGNFEKLEMLRQNLDFV